MKLYPEYAVYGTLAAEGVGWVAGQLELTTACFQNCAFCRSKTDPASQAIASEKQVDKLLHELAMLPYFHHLSLTGGDPQAWEPLERLLYGYLKEGLDEAFSLQMNTVVARPIRDPGLWKEALRNVRVSLDAATSSTYQKVRGVRGWSPAFLLEQLQRLQHPRLAFICTASDLNVDELSDIVHLLEYMAEKGLVIRKVIFLPAMGVEHSPVFWRKFQAFQTDHAGVTLPFETNLAAESPLTVRTYLDNPEGSSVRCYAGSVGFHIKSNGDLYPCCLVGGEAVETCQSLRVGNVWGTPLISLQQDAHEYRGLHYADSQLPCREICQWKQLQINLAGTLAEVQHLTLP